MDSSTGKYLLLEFSEWLDRFDIYDDDFQVIPDRLGRYHLRLRARERFPPSFSDDDWYSNRVDEEKVFRAALDAKRHSLDHLDGVIAS